MANVACAIRLLQVFNVCLQHGLGLVWMTPWKTEPSNLLGGFSAPFRSGPFIFMGSGRE